MSFVSLCFALMAGAFAGQVASAQTLVLTKTPAVTDIYSSGVQAFPATAVGTNSAVINLKLTVTGGALRITSIGLPALPTGSTRIPQFTVGAITGCTVNGTTSNATGTVCTVPITFNPAYVGYQTSPLVAVTSNGNFQYGLNGMGTGPQAILLPGILSTVAGNGTVQATATKYTGDGGQATAAQVLSHGFAFDALGNLYEAEYDADVIRKISPTGVISTVIGAETTAGGVETSTVCTTPNTVPSCGDGGVATAANFGQFLPDVALDSAGNIYVADSIDNRIRRVDAVTNIINTIAGTGNALTTGTGNNGDGAAATAADLNTPEAVLLDNADNIYMLNSNAIVAAPATTNPSVIRYIDSATGVITTLAGVATPCTATGAGTCGDGGPASAANLAIAASFYLDPTTGNYWIADRDANRIRFVNRATGIISTVAGTGVKGYTGDGGLATAATLDGPHGIWVDPAGDLYISDRGNNVVRYVSASTGIISTIAGGGAACAAAGNGSCGDGGLSNGPLANMTPEDVRLDVNGNVYVGDGENDAIRKITTSPITLTFPTVPVGTTSGPLTAVLRNIGSSTLTYTTPTSGTNAAISTTGPTATASNAFAQGNTTTCGPISSTSAANDTLASGASCNFVVTFTPDTAAGNYTGTLIETDNSLNAGAGNTHYPTDSTQTVNLVGAATVQTATITLTSTPNPSTYGTSVAFTATLSGVAGSTVPTGTVAFTYTAPGSTTVVSIGTGTISTVNGAQVATINYALFPVGTNTVTATYSGDSNYASGTKATDSQVVSVAAGSKDTLTATPTTSTFGTSVALTFTVPTTAGLTAPSGTVTFTSGGVTLGTATIATAGGVSTAVINTTKLPVGTDTITATYPGDANYGSAAPTATETVTQAAGTDTLTANPTTSQFGSPVVLTFTVPTVAGATANPTGTVTFSSGGITLGTGTLTTTGTGASAVTTATLTTSALAPGTDTITGAYPGDTNYSAQSPTTTETVGAATGTYILTAAPVTSTYGAPVVLTFTVPLINGVAPTGTVTFTNGTTTLGTGTINASGVATLTTTALPVGTDTVKGSYPGDANYTAGTATATETVAKADGGTADTLTATPATSTFGSPVVLKFTVPTVAGAAASPTGTVTFTQGTTTLGTGTLTTTGTGANAVTTATLTTSSLPVGTDTVIGTYPGDANYSNAAPTATEAVTKATPADTLTYSPAAPTFGAPVTLTFTIPTVTGATATPTGTVTFTNGTTQLGTGTITTVGGVSTATITTTALPVGSDTVTATYPGDTNYAAAAPTATVPVTKASPTDTLAANPTTSAAGTPVILTFTVPTIAGATTAPTGTVTFTSGGVTLGTGTLSTSGTGATAVTTATLTTSALPVGTDTVTGTYPGDANYAAAAPTTTETVGPATGADTLTANPSNPTYGAPVVLTFTVPLVNGVAPTGTVTFTYGTTTLGTGTINASGVATLTTTALPVGSDVVKGSYPGDANYTAGTATTTVTVGKVGPTPADTLTANPTTSTFGSPVVLTFTAPTVAGATASPTGTVTFTNGTTTLGTATLTTTGTGATAVTTATLTTSSLPVGSDTIVGTYPGDTNYPAEAPTATETVSVATPADTLTYAPAAPTYGSPVVLTFTIPPVTGASAPPTGTVTFTNGTTQLGTGTITTVGGVSTATITTTSLPVGSDVVTATYPGNANYAAAAPTATVPVTKAAGTGDTLTANPTSATFGSPVVLTFTVPTVTGAAASPTGTVTFTSGGVTLGTGTLSTTGTGANAVTTATLTTSALPTGTDTVTGTYPGDTNYANGSATTTVTIGAATGADTLTANPASSTFGSPVVLTFTVPLINGTAPTGTVTFTNGTTTLGTAAVNASGQATLTTTALPVGTDPLKATYPGDANYAAAAPTATETVAKASGNGDTLTANPTTSTYGASVVLTFTVPTVAGATASPTGTVTFTQGATTLGTGTLTTTGTGAAAVTTATLTTNSLPVGTDTIIGTYPGDANYSNAAPTATETVTAASGTGDTLTYSPSAPTFGSPVVLTFTIPPVTGATAAPTGTVTFTNGTTQLGTGTITTVGGVSTATITTTSLPVGNDVVTATYPGNGSYAAAAPTATVPVTKASGAGDTLTANPTSSTYGASVVLTFTVPTVAGATASPTGTVTFTNGTTTLGTGTLSTTGTGANAVTTATLTTTALPVGTDTVTGTYPGDTNYANGSATATETVASAGTDTLTASPSPSTFGAPVTLTFTVPTVAGASTSPTGTVTFTSGGVTLGTGTISTVNGVSTATLTTTALPVGTDTITAAYPGSPNYPAASPTTTDTINKAGGTGAGDTLTANPTTSTVGSPVVLTFTVAPAVAGASASPTGTVTFTSGGVTLGTGTLTTTGTGANAVTTATLTTSTLPVGTDTVTGTYPGDTNYVGGNATATETVSKGAGTGDTLTANPTTTTYGSPVVLTFTVAPITGVTTAPTGSVTFTSGTQTLGTATITTTGGVSTATITTTALPVGSDLITGTYAGDTNYGAATPTATETITKSNGGSGGPTLSVNPTSTAFGSPVVVTYNEGTVAGATLPATGTVVFTSGGITLGTGTLTTTGTGATAVTTATITTSVLPVGTDTITGTYGGDTNYNGAAPTATETVGAAGSDTITATPSPATYGAPVTLTFNVPTPAGVTTNPTGTVTFTSGGVTLGTAPIATLNGTSTATITTTVLPIGTDTITATYGGSPNYPAAAPTTNETINKAAFGAPNDVLTTNPNPSTFGQTVTITETLTTVGAAAPTGSINFIYNGTSLGTATITGGVASITTATLPVGTDPITATYAGDANYAAGTSGPVNQVVNQALSIATLAAGPNPATYGTPVTLTETITPINGTCPAGPATFLNNGTTLGTGTISLSGGYCVAMLTTSTLPVGTDQITATVPGSGGFDPTTSGPVALVINKANNADTLASSPNPSVFGSPVTITDTIPTVAGTAPTGTVNFFDFGVQIGTGTVNAAGVATLVTSTLPVGTDSLTATYLGDGNYAQVTAGPVNQVVSPVSGNQATLAVGPNPATFGTKVTFTETIPTVNGTPATGQVLFYQNSTLVGAGTLAGGVATITTTTLPVGTDPITATYGGDTNYAAASSGPVNEIINKAIGADTLAVSPDPALVGTTVTMTDTIPTVGGVAPTGTVTFYDNGTAIGTGTVNGQGVATLTTTALPIGSDPITAVYGGDGNYAPVTTGPVNEVITQISEPVALGANPNPAAFGATVTLTESVPGINGISPTGSVTFYDSGTAIGTAPLTNGVATLPVSNLPIGTDPITATYTGDTNYAGANSGPLNVVITTVPSADTLTANPNPSTFGSPVTLTFTVPPVNGVAPTGTVTFYNGTTPIGTATISPSGIATLTTSQLPFGTDPITAKYPGDNTYAPASPTVTVTVNPVSPTSVVTVPAGSPICGSSVTLTDTITPVNGVALGGTVQFYDNGTAIGSPVPVPASGIVTLTTTSLACTTDIITAIYTPPANSPYLPSTGGPTSITVNKPDFSITATPPNQTVNPGDTTTYTVSLSGVGLPFTSPVTLTATGLPPGATVSFANGTYVPNAGPTSTTMTIVTAPNQAVLHHSSSTNGIYYGLLLLPLLGLGKVRRKIKALPKGITYCLAGLIMLGGLGAVTGCGGGYFGPAPQTFTITVTGTSGTLVHSTTVTLTVR